MDASGNKVLTRMLERLFAAIVSGPSLNCRPHASRQRLDLTQVAKVGGIAAWDCLNPLLSEAGAFEVVASVPAPATGPARGRFAKAKPQGGDEVTGETAEQAAARRVWSEQQAVLSKLRVVVEDARTYENDTGAYVLNIGFPLVSIPPRPGAGRSGPTRRVLAPVAFIPVSVTARAGASAVVRVESRGEGVDRVIANDALLAWIEQNTGVKMEEVFADEDGADPWKEIAGLVRHVAKALEIDTPDVFRSDVIPAAMEVTASPRGEEAGGTASIVPSAVVGLFPVANQGLLRDTQAMLGGEPVAGPVESFLRSDAVLNPVLQQPDAPAGETRPGSPVTTAAPRRLVATADPCQARAVGLARESAGLVIHGPPGTGKSQTITNIIGDHLARGQRVLFVCDKRTALDVVANRLDSLGLAGLCALVHDPQRDQRELYMSIREQLESLPEVKTHPLAGARLGKIDAELEEIYAELRAVHAGLRGTADGQGESLSALVERWVTLQPSGGVGECPAVGPAAALDQVSPAVLEAQASGLRETLQRGAEIQWPRNPWRLAAGLTVESLVARPMEHFRAAFQGCMAAAERVDATMDARVPPLVVDVPLEAQAAARDRLRRALEVAMKTAPSEARRHWTGRTPPERSAGQRLLHEAEPWLKTFRASTPDTELLAAATDGGGASPSPTGAAAGVPAMIAALKSYLEVARKWWGFAALGKRSAATRALRPLGLALSPENAARGLLFLRWRRAAQALAEVSRRLAVAGPPAHAPATPTRSVLDHHALDADLRAHEAMLAVFSLVEAEPSLRPLETQVAGALASDTSSPSYIDLLEGLRLSAPRAQALAAMEAAAQASGLFDPMWMMTEHAAARGGRPMMPLFTALSGSFASLEEVLRVRAGVEALAKPLSHATAAMLMASTPVEGAMRLLMREVTAGEIIRRLAAQPLLRGLDPRRVQTLFERARTLEEEKRGKVRDAVLHRWTAQAKERLVASTGSRLSTQGAELRRRLTTRGKRAMRLRQVVALGRGMEGGDPLMDLRPVWMASPETVAQVFPRTAAFDVVIFDEASQCRLEEAIPVCTRAKRVVIAGDAHQLPPTRFFESAVAQSENEDVESEQELFEAQQGEVEDLLGAALNLDIEQSYLDVHYRSRNADLIAFSNEHFYARRLQALPAHPSRVARFAPVTVHRAEGVYAERCNEKEAERVCRIVHDLLRRAEPPTIGIACFNIAQRDLIIEKLEEMAAGDAWFAGALAGARERRGHGAAEGLFVKNLENVQGDERDHIIISTTYGPTAEGKFYKRFGPLAMPGGGRRLNVLITRARDEVHLVTSIPRGVYTALPPVPKGVAPSGAWLLFAYLKFAEELATAYETAVSSDAREESGDNAPDTPVKEPADAQGIGDTDAPVDGLARALKDRCGVASRGPWGNEGFRVDLAVGKNAANNLAPEVTLGVLRDTAHYTMADDGVEWDMFRSAVLVSQGWALHRVWSPVLFRDLQGQLEAIAKAAGR